MEGIIHGGETMHHCIMKFLALTALTLMIGGLIPGTSSTASAEESVYPGEDPLLVGQNVRSNAQNFSWLRGCGYNYDYNGYLDKLKKYSKADWRYFRRRTTWSYDGSSGCRPNAIKGVVEWLENYMDWIVHLAEKCEGNMEKKQNGKMECGYAGRKF